MRKNIDGLLFQPQKKPDSILKYLSSCFRRIEYIKKAYFCCLQKSNANDIPSVVIGLDCSTALDSIEKDLKLILADSGFSEVMVVNAKLPPFSDHFNYIEPFYKM